ncbi:hypothetical protein EXIGLDRAFT_732331 [Exidia glandulosa HHB12029]|nr:hypothetical protein EXIGLDRAFT_732331 [Exidia glandulosa HHB12029]
MGRTSMSFGSPTTTSQTFTPPPHPGSNGTPAPGYSSAPPPHGYSLAPLQIPYTQPSPPHVPQAQYAQQQHGYTGVAEL